VREKVQCHICGRLVELDVSRLAKHSITSGHGDPCEGSGWELTINHIPYPSKTGEPERMTSDEFAEMQRVKC